jgi:predicted nucleotidyltransferase
MKTTITDFAPELAWLLPITYQILRMTSLTVYETVCQINLEGSRGLAGGYRPDSDIDLTLIVDRQKLPAHEPERGELLREVLETTLSHWNVPLSIYLDLAVVFDKGDCCDMRCFNERSWKAAVIRGRGVDCFGIYKIQRGFDGYVESGVLLEKMYPMLTIWRREPD